MKKIFSIAIALFTITTAANGQAVRDRNVIPLAVNLNQVLRMSITDGGNIEFTFNSIEDYRSGLSGDAGTSGSANPATSDPMYVSNFIIASSTRWELSYGSEQATFIGTDNPANTLTLDNVGFTLLSNGVHTFGTELTSAPTVDGTEVSALEQFPVVLITDNGNPLSSAGDVLDNDFTIIWRAGTAEVGAAPATMNPVVLLEQNPSPTPDRYVTSVLFELAAL
jgi:hypothetical protein